MKLELKYALHWVNMDIARTVKSGLILLTLNNFGANIQNIHTSKSHVQQTFSSHFCNSITRQVIELVSCSNPQKMQQVLQFALKKIGKF